MYLVLGFENFTAQISLRDKENKENIGSDENWEKAEELLSMLQQTKD
jgi:threonyl-tRNA synthetase